MIRINLLPIKKQQEKESSKRLLVLFVLFIIAECIILWFPYASLQNDLEDLSNTNTQKTQEIESLKTQVKDVERLTGEKNNLTEQLDVLSNLEQGRSGPVRVMDEVQLILSTPANELERLTFDKRGWNSKWDPSRLWFNSFQETGGRFLLKGGSLSSDDVAEFLQRLESSVYFADVQLIAALTKDTKELEYVGFEIVGAMSYSARSKAKTDKDKKGKGKGKTKKKKG